MKSHVKKTILKSGESLSNTRSPSQKKLEKAKYSNLLNKKKEGPNENRNR